MSGVPLSQQTARLMLRCPTSADVDAVFAIHADPATNQFNPAGPMLNQAEASILLDLWRAHWSQRGFGFWTVALREQPQQVIGFGGVMHRLVGDRLRLNLYFRFAAAYWGQGYAREMAQAALQLAFEHLAEPSVVAKVRPDNAASCRLLDYLRMQVRQHIHDVPNEPPSLMYEIVANEYRAAGAL